MHKILRISSLAEYYLQGYDNGLNWGSTLRGGTLSLEQQHLAMAHRLKTASELPHQLQAINQGVYDRLQDEIAKKPFKAVCSCLGGDECDCPICDCEHCSWRPEWK